MEPVIYEKDGIDQNGNKFHEKDVILQGKSDLNPDNKYQSFFKTLDVVGDNSRTSNSENYEYFEDVSKPGHHINIQLVPKQLTAEDYFEAAPTFESPILLPGLHYNLQKTQEPSESIEKRIRLLKSQLGREDELINEMKNALSENQPISPVEDLIESLMTVKYGPESDEALPTFREKLNENVELAKKSGLTNLDMGHRVNPNIFIDLIDENESASPKHVDYFEPVFVDGAASKEKGMRFLICIRL